MLKVVELVEFIDIDTPSDLLTLGVYKVGLHFIQLLFAFLTLCIAASVIAAERYFTGSSQAAPNYTLTVAILSLFLSIPLAVFPWSKYRNHLTPVRNFFLRPRTTVIFTCFLTLGWFAAMISMTVHANTSSTCTLDAKLQKSNSGYASAWMKQCNSAKAAAAFSWISFFLWLATAVASVILFWHEKKIRHAEASAAATAAAAATVAASASYNSNYDEDARTIVDMEYLDKEKQPVAHYDTVSTAPTQDAELEYTRSPTASPETLQHPLPVPPSAPPMNAYTSPYTTHSVVNSAVASPYVGTTPPVNLTSPYTPHSTHITNVGSPYTVPTSVASPSYPVHSSPYTPYQQPYTTQPFAVSSHQPPYQQSPLSYTSSDPYQNSPLAHNAQLQHHQQQPYQSSPLAYSTNNNVSSYPPY